jgi:hypothetical protein
MKEPSDEPRTCGWCDKIICYGLFCSNECSNAHYEQWKRLTRPTTTTRRIR